MIIAQRFNAAGIRFTLLRFSFPSPVASAHRSLYASKRRTHAP
jgi:hypothetical protein